MNSQIVWILILIVMTTLGCRREDSNPELSDRIYLDLLSEARNYEQQQSEAMKKLEQVEKELAETAPRTIDRKNAEREVASTRKKLTQATEMLEFYKIRAERRRVEGRRAYKLAFRSGKDWPNKNEYESYMVNKRLVQASRSWKDRSLAAEKPPEAEPKSGAH